MGTVAITAPYNDVSNNKRVVEANVTMSSSYATGGDTVPLTSLGLREVTDVVVLGSVAHVNSGGAAVTPHGIQVVLAGTKTAPLLKAYSGSTSEVANATNLSTNGALRIRFLGTE